MRIQIYVGHRLLGIVRKMLPCRVKSLRLMLKHFRQRLLRQFLMPCFRRMVRSISCARLELMRQKMLVLGLIILFPLLRMKRVIRLSGIIRKGASFIISMLFAEVGLRKCGDV